jgi:hypothetical protein
MQGVCSGWLPQLQEHHRHLHGEELDVYNWWWFYTAMTIHYIFG